MSSRSRSLLSRGIILAVVLAWFSPWWIGGRNLAPLDLLNGMMSPWRGTSTAAAVKNHIVSDAVDQYLVYRSVAAASYAREGGLGWSSLTYGGTAEYANTMALYFDWTMQLHRWCGFWTAWHLGLLGQVLIAAFGMHAFLRGRGIVQLWAVCGALAYAANSQFVTWIYHRWALGAFCWVPWILWAIDLHRHGRRRAWALVPGFTAMAYFGGTLQHAALVACVLAAAWADEAWTAGRTAPLAIQTRILARHGVWGILAVGLAAPMFLPCIGAFLESSRLGLHMGMHGTAAMGLYPKGILQPILNLAAYPLQIFPSALGRAGSVDLLKLFRSELFYIAYFGALPVAVALLSLFRRNAPPLARILITMGLLLPLTPLVRHLYQRTCLLFILGGILAFVHFMQHAPAPARRKLARVSGWVAAAGATVWLLASVLLKMNEPGVAAILEQKIVEPSGGSSFGYFREWMALRAERFLADLYIWSPQQFLPLALLAAGIAGLWMTSLTGAARQRRGALLLATVVVLEVTLFGSRWIVFSDPGNQPLFAATAESEVLVREVGHDGRTATIQHPTAHMARTPFLPNTLSAYGIATLHGYDSIMPDGMFRVNDPRRDAESLGRLGVTHLIAWPGAQVDAGWEKIWNSPSMDLYQNERAFPRYAGFRDGPEMEHFFTTGTTAPRVALQETSGLENSRVISLPSDIRWVRIAENYGSGWEYRMAGGAWRPVLRAPDYSMLLDLKSDSAGEVRMRYHPPLWRAGLGIFALAAAGCLAGMMISCRRLSGIDSPPSTTHPLTG